MLKRLVTSRLSLLHDRHPEHRLLPLLLLLRHLFLLRQAALLVGLEAAQQTQYLVRAKTGHRSTKMHRRMSVALGTLTSKISVACYSNMQMGVGTIRGAPSYIVIVTILERGSPALVLIP